MQIAISTNVFAATGGGTMVGGGGEAVDLDGRPALRDLIDKTTCFWKFGNDFAKYTNHLPRVLEQLTDLHWMLAVRIKAELETLYFCETSTLRRVPTEDEDAVSAYKIKTKQVAVRIHDKIYVDMNIFRKMSAKDRAYLILHEVGHSMISSVASRRNQKLRSFIAAIRLNETRPLSQDDFALQIKANEILISEDVSDISEEVKTLVLKVYNYSLSVEERKAAALELVGKYDADIDVMAKKVSESRDLPESWIKSTLQAERKRYLTTDFLNEERFQRDFSDLSGVVDSSFEEYSFEMMLGCFYVSGYFIDVFNFTCLSKILKENINYNTFNNEKDFQIRNRMGLVSYIIRKLAISIPHTQGTEK